MIKGKKLVLLILLFLSVGSYTLISKNLAATGTGVLKKQNDQEISVTFGKNIARSSFEIIEVVNHMNIPTNAITSWDASADNDNSVKAWYTDTNNNGLYELYIGGNGVVYANPDSKYAFQRFDNVTEMKLEKLNTSKVTTMDYMFGGNSTKLQKVNITNFNTSNVTSMMGLFNNCQKLTEIIGLNSFNTSKVTDMQQMFRGCSSLTSLDLSNFNTSQATNMAAMFYNCSSLTSLDLSNFNTSQATSMVDMFYNCSSLTSLDLSNFDTSRVTIMSRMFYNCNSLTTLDISNFSTTDNINMYYMFGTTFGTKSNLEKIKIGNNMRFNIATRNGMFLRGTWKKLEDNKTYSSIDIMKNSLLGNAGGTYIKQADISDALKVDYPVKYKINKITQIDNMTTTNPNVFSLIDNKNIGITLSLSGQNSYTIPGEVEILIEDVVTDADNNLYDLKVKLENIILYSNSDNFDLSLNKREVLYITDIGSLMLNGIAVDNNNQIHTTIDTTMQILDKNGIPAEGSFLFSAYHMDASYEEIEFLLGFDMSTIRYADDNLVFSGNKISGNNNTPGNEYSEFVIKGNSEGVKFKLYQRNLTNTDFFVYYQPKSVEIKKVDNHGNNVIGANLELYHLSELTESWDTNNNSKNLFLMPGEYTLKEVTPPEGYESSEDITFYVDINDKLTINNKEVNDIEMIDNLVKKKYKVNYLEKGTNKVLSPQKISSDTEYGTTINSNDEKIDITNYKFDSSDKSSITIDVDESKNIINLYYTRVEKTVTINKLVYGNMADINKEFNFNVEVKDIDGVVDNNRSTTFKLKDNGVKTLSIPIGYTITISEEVDNNYTTTVNNSNTNSITKVINNNEEITFKNTYDESSSTGIKTIALPYILLIILLLITIFGIRYISYKIKV